jgi:hypothetical protein
MVMIQKKPAPKVTHLLIFCLIYTKKYVAKITVHIPYSIENSMAIFLEGEFEAVKSLTA